jgi:hypothetical protein
MVEETPHEDVDVVVEGRREQHALPFRRGGIQEPAHDGQEPEISHVVGLVEDADLHVTEVAVALLDEVGQAAWAGDDDVGAIAQGGDLRAIRRAAVDGHDAQAHDLGQRQKNGLDLAGQLTSRNEDQAARPARHGVSVGERGHHGDGERERLSRARPAAAQDVAAGQRVGQRGGLDRERSGDACLGKRGYDRRGNPESRE